MSLYGLKIHEDDARCVKEGMTDLSRCSTYRYPKYATNYRLGFVVVSAPQNETLYKFNILCRLYCTWRREVT